MCVFESVTEQTGEEEEEEAKPEKNGGSRTKQSKSFDT